MPTKITDQSLLDELNGKVLNQELLQDLDNDDFSVSTMVGNIPASAKQFGKDVVAPLLSPIETGKGLAKLAGSAIAKGEESLVDLAPDSWVANINKLNNYIADKTGLLTTLPETKGEMKAEGTETAEAVGKFFNDRYGTWDKTKKTIMSDPVGSLSDAAAVMTGGGALVPKLAPKVGLLGKSIDPVNMAVNTAKTTAGILTPESLPANLYQRAAKFSGAKNAPDSAVITKTAMDYKIPPNVKGVGKLEVLKGELIASLDQMIDAAEATGINVPVGAVYKNLGDIRREMGGVKLRGASNAKAINAVAKEFSEHMKSIGRDSLSAKELQDFKLDIYADNKYGQKTLQGTRINEKVEKAFARAAKEILEKYDPKIKDVNAEIGRLQELEPELLKVATRNDRRNLLSIDTPLQMSAGATAAGPVGGAVGATSSLLSYPNVTSGLGLGLNAAKQRGLKGLLNTNGILPLISQGMFQSGRNQNR